MRARPVLLALLCILAIAAAAATLDSAVSVDGEFGISGGSGADNETADGDVPRDMPTPSNASTASDMPGLQPLCIPALANPQFLMSAGVVALVGAYLLYRWRGPYVPLGIAAGIGPLVLLAYIALTSCVDGDSEDGSFVPGGPMNASDGSASGAGEGLVGGASGAVSAPSLLLVGAVVTLLLASIALYVVSSTDREIDVREEPEETSEEAPVAIGRIAGRTADRIEEDAGLENEVYRAWHEMTTHLEVANPESSSPGEFVDAAVDAGMDRDDVTRLTRLFEEVRYGTAEATAERERRAVDTLRRIEETYGGADS